MAKPNLTSIFTSSNQYSVLKLLKALCDAVDNIDYADNTEFTNFKEQVNSAVNSLEQSIMSNENAISDLNTVTGNNSTEINSIKSKISGINTDANGNVAVGKNLEVDGTTKLNGGLEPIHTYEIDSVTTLYVYFEYMKYGDFIGYGWIINIGTVRPCIFHYSLQDGKVIRFRGISDDIIYDYNSNNNLTKTFGIAKADNVQAKLYRHRITLRNASSADGTCMLDWISSNNLQCRSLEDLRTLLNNPQMKSYVASNPSGDLFGVVISTSTAQFKKAGTTSLVNITSVDDTVTLL